MTLLGFNDYQEKAMRTLNDKGMEMNILHCVMGMTGELGELTEVYANAPKSFNELGDCFWYAAVLARVLDEDFDDVYLNSQSIECGLSGVKEYTMLSGFLPAARMIDMVKKTVFYGKVLDTEELLRTLVLYAQVLFAICEELGYDPMEVCAANIEKLKTRYPEKYADHLAINKDEHAEAAAVGIK